MPPMENATPTSAYTHASSTQTASTVHAQSTQTKPIVYTQSTKRNRRGGACVPARTSAQRRFHTKNMRIVCGDFNDGCAPAGRHGRAHRHRPYQSPSYFSTQSHTNKITIYAQSHTNEINRLRVILPNDIIHPNETRKQSPPHNRGRKCIAHSRPLNSK